MGLPPTLWIKLDNLGIGVGKLYLSMHKRGLVFLPDCECKIAEQITEHVLTACPIYQPPDGAKTLTVLGDKTGFWLNTHATSNLSEE